MGQQQLLLLVLGIVIVGLAVVVGINAFGENQKRANADAMVNDALRIASDIQAYALKPAQFGGAGGFDNVDASDAQFFRDKIGYPNSAGGTYSNVNGAFTLENASGSIIINGLNADQDNQVRVRVCGVTSRDIFTAITYDPDAAVVEPDACGTT